MLKMMNGSVLVRVTLLWGHNYNPNDFVTSPPELSLTLERHGRDVEKGIYQDQSCDDGNTRCCIGLGGEDNAECGDLKSR